MLVLTRKVGQSIEISPGIYVMVVSIKDNQVRLGIEAPKHVNIRRGEAVNVYNDEGRLDVQA
jgi:carbon storage regulator